MDHVVYLDAKEKELDKLIRDEKSMIIPLLYSESNQAVESGI